MDAQDGQVPAPRHASLPRLRRPIEPTALPFAALPDEQAPRVADLSALLDDIDSLRLTLQTDLTLAAAALEAEAAGLSVELVEGDLTEVRAFGARAAGRLAALQAADDADAGDGLPDEEPVTVPALPRRRILSAAPLMAAAAALIGFVAFVPERGGSGPETTMTSAAMAGYELRQLAASGASDEALRLAAEELNDELAMLIQRAAHDPAAAQQALMLLQTTSEVLAGQGDSGVLRGVMVETQLLRARLRDALPETTRRARTVRKAVQTPPVLPVVEAQPEKSRESAAPSPKPSSTPKASPKPSPSSEPTSAPQPASTPTSEPSEGSGPLGYEPGELPGS